MTIEKTTDAIVRQHSGGKASISQDDPAITAVQDEISALLDAEVDVALHMIKLDALDLDKNHLRPVTLAGLAPIIQD